MAGKGSLILVIGFGVIMMYVITNLTSLGTRATEHMTWYNNATASKTLASIGINQGLAYLRAPGPPDIDAKIAEGWWFGGWQEITEGAYSGGRYRVRADEIGSRVRVRTVSEYPMTRFQDLEDTVDVYLELERVNEYTMFGWIANIPGNANFFYGGDIIWGPIHQNGGIHLGNIAHGQEVPIFHGKVTAGQNISPVGGDRAKLLAGYEVGTNEVSVPQEFDVMRTAAQSERGRSYDDSYGDLVIELDGKNVSVWREGQDPASDEPYEVIMIDNQDEFNGAIYSTENISIKGTLDGELEIGSGKDVNIIGDIKYATDPAYRDTVIVPGSQNEYGIDRVSHIPIGEDLLGIYAANDVVVDAGNRDVEVHGILLALGELRAADPAAMDGLYKFDTWGSVVMRGRGDMRNGPGTRGLIQRYRYDVRLEDPQFRPRFFPGTVTSSFKIVSWYESIQLPPF